MMADDVVRQSTKAVDRFSEVVKGFGTATDKLEKAARVIVEESLRKVTTAPAGCAGGGGEAESKPSGLGAHFDRIAGGAANRLGLGRVYEHGRTAVGHARTTLRVARSRGASKGAPGIPRPRGGGVGGARAVAARGAASPVGGAAAGGARAAGAAAGGGGAGAAAGAARGAAGLFAIPGVGEVVAVGGIVVAAGLALKAFRDAVAGATKSALDSARHFAELSGPMAAVMAQRDVRNMLRDMQIGNETAGSTGTLAAAEARRKDAEAPIEIAVTNLTNNVLAIANDILTPIALGVKNMIELLKLIPGVKGFVEVKGDPDAVGIARLFPGIEAEAAKAEARGKAAMAALRARVGGGVVRPGGP